MNKQEYAIKTLESSHENTRCELRLAAERLKSNLERLLEELDKPEPCVNACGEVQSDGTFIDRQCALFCSERRTLRIVRQMDEAETKREEN